MVMGNNLDEMISKSGLAKKEVAAAKGITPETLSRHVHGKIQMTLQDAEQYAKLLGCTAQEILFAAPAIKLIANWELAEDGRPFVKQDNRNCLMYLNTYFNTDTAAIGTKLPKDKPFQFEMWAEQVEIIDYRPALSGDVSPDCFQRPSYAMLDDGKIVWGLVYPEPGNVFTVYAGEFNAAFKSYKSVKLQWACPTLSVIRRPELIGVHFVGDK
jgi:DNA-binding Xre family transcriptional regulator